MKFWPVFGIVCLCVVLIAAAGLAGYIVGYEDGAKTAIEYASRAIEKIKVNTVNIEFNQTKVDQIVDDLKNMTSRLNDRINSLNNLSEIGIRTNCSGVLC